MIPTITPAVLNRLPMAWMSFLDPEKNTKDSLQWWREAIEHKENMWHPMPAVNRQLGYEARFVRNS